MRTALLFFMLVSSLAAADEGMWLYNDFPAEKVKALGATVDEKWLQKARLGSLRLAGGCSASFVSPEGLVMTNHHCIRSCLEDLSSSSRNLLAMPFVAAKRENEERCPKIEANQLIDIVNVTDKVMSATKGLSGAEYQKQLKAEQAKIQNECAQGDAKKRCDIVTLFNGAQFHLYVYRRFQDVRMVFAPEFQQAAFGGDPDNFNFPRYGSDFAFLRVYEDGQPKKTPEALRFTKGAAKAGDTVFVSGHPGGTERNRTVAQLEFYRDVSLPRTLLDLAEVRGRMSEWIGTDVERKRVAESGLRSVENGLKAQRGRQKALVSLGFLDGKRAAEQALITKAPETKAAFEAIDQAMQAYRPLFEDYRFLEGGEAFRGELFQLARSLLRAADESKKSQAERLPEYTDARRPGLEQTMASTAPISKQLETALLTWSLTRWQNLKGADDALVKTVLGKKSAETLAAELVAATKLDDVNFRKKVLSGEISGEDDALIRLARQVDAPSRALRTTVENTVDAVVRKNFEVIQSAKSKVYGTQGYPDATFSLRLSFGTIQGVGPQPAMTTVKGFFDRLTGSDPFAATAPWLAAQKSLPPTTPFNISTTNDIIGGNSGSPLLNAKGEVVGLIFDGNLPSLGGNFFYEPKENRATAVHASLIRLALSKVYAAAHIEAELMR
jgi:hypothetical protein